MKKQSKIKYLLQIIEAVLLLLPTLLPKNALLTILESAIAVICLTIQIIYAISSKTNASMNMLAIASFTTSNVWLIVSDALWVKQHEVNFPVLIVYAFLLAFGLTAYDRINKATSINCDMHDANSSNKKGKE